eukprot:1158690-Pelagomonas_calceolata.AAC.4
MKLQPFTTSGYKPKFAFHKFPMLSVATYLQAGGVPSGLRHAAQAAKEQDQAKLFIIKSPTRMSVQETGIAMPSPGTAMSGHAGTRGGMQL